MNWSTTRGGSFIGTDPTRTWVFAVDIGEYQDPNLTSWSSGITLSYIRKALASRVPDRRVVFLCDREATLTGIRDAFGNLLRNMGENDALIFYFGGHVGKAADGSGCLLPYDADGTDKNSWWSFRKIIAKANQSFGTVVLVIDTCYFELLEEALQTQVPHPDSHCSNYTIAGLRCDNPGQHPPRREKEGLSVEVEQGGAWHPAVALRSERGRYLIHYGDDAWDEWVEQDRVRVPEPAEDPTPLRPETMAPPVTDVPATGRGEAPEPPMVTSHIMSIRVPEKSETPGPQVVPSATGTVPDPVTDDPTVVPLQLPLKPGPTPDR